MFKGQAFDTFKLMIAAVIAVAILGILLGILGQIDIVGQSFPDTSKQLIQRAIQSPPAIIPSSGEVSFKSGEVYPESIFQTAAGGRTTEFHSASGFCTIQSASADCNNICCIDSNKATLVIGRDFRAKLYVCCDQSSSTSTPKCKIGIGSSVNCG